MGALALNVAISMANPVITDTASIPKPNVGIGIPLIALQTCKESGGVGSPQNPSLCSLSLL